jgi:hypothetical protein
MHASNGRFGTSRRKALLGEYELQRSLLQLVIDSVSRNVGIEEGEARDQGSISGRVSRFGKGYLQSLEYADSASADDTSEQGLG